MFKAIMNGMQRSGALPKISDTERTALEAGTVWVDGELFSGNPDWEKILNDPYNGLTAEEQAYIDGPVTELCQMVDSWEISKTREVPQEIWDFLGANGFFAMNISKEYGGNKMGAVAKSTIMTMVGAANVYVGTLVVIPNSLGASELLMDYGTDEQKKQYLPKLADGTYIPCFGLTEPTAGSDAASIKAEGVVFKDDDGEIKVRLNFRKRYITMAPQANLISLAYQMHDPDNLLGKGEYPGITVSLLEKGMDGLYIGDHHDPMNASFPNGPIVGRDVVSPVGDIIGGQEYAGKGWMMLMQALAGGRAVSLPANGIGMCKGAAAATGPWSMVREQFNMPIGHMEAIEQVVAKIAGLTYGMDAARVYSCSALDNGEKPPVISAVMKAYSTEIGRELLKDGLDVMAGSAVQQGPNNVLGNPYMQAPIAITVEGANIMTRTLIVFGQGAIRCHPHAFNVVEAVEQSDHQKFRKELLGWMGHVFMTTGRVFARYFSRGLTSGTPKTASKETKKYYRKLGWASARFAFLTEVALFLVGARLKRRGKLTGRYADALSWMYVATATLRRYEAEGKKEDAPIMRWVMNYSLFEVQKAIQDIYANINVMNWWFRGLGRLFLILNPMARGPRDHEEHLVAAAIQKPGEQMDRLLGYLPEPKDSDPGMGRLMRAFRLMHETRPLKAQIKNAMKEGVLEQGEIYEAIDAAVSAKVLTEAEGKLFHEARQAQLAAYEVDVFSPEEYLRRGDPYPTALGGAQEALYGEENVVPLAKAS